MAREPDLVVEVVYALPGNVIAATAQVPPGATVADAIAQVEFAQLVTDADLVTAPVGIFGRVVARNTPVRDGDRIEIYRPLVTDAKQARRKRSNSKVRRGG